MQVVKEVLPAYRAKFSKHLFTQPQLFAVLCLMRVEEWTFREAEVRLREHAQLRAALELKGCRITPHFIVSCVASMRARSTRY
jgi:hypothetical protein